MKAVLAALLALLAPSECGAQTQPQGPHAVAVVARPVPLRADAPMERQVGELTWAGGLELTAPADRDFGGLSGLDVAEDGRSFVSQSDTGYLYRGRLVLDGEGRLTGVEKVSVAPLLDEAGARYHRKAEADAEDVTLLPDGGYAISFEQRHRVFRYGPDGGAGVAMPVSPDIHKRAPNLGLEALAWKSGHYYEGAEDGEIWRCDDHPGGACSSVLPTSPFATYKLTGLDAAGRGFVAVYRSATILHRWRAIVAWMEPADAEGDGPWRVRPLAVLARPYTRDNMEGIAAIPRPDGGFRLYLISDDNLLHHLQRTLLLAFDWKGPHGLSPPSKAGVG